MTFSANQASLFGAPEPRAVFSPCTVHDEVCDLDCVGRLYRYELEWPTGNPGTNMMLLVLANPSKATHLRTDNTVAKGIGYARRWGFAWCGVANARAWRETHPELVPADPLAIGPDNDGHIFEMAVRAELVICGWGKLGGARGPAVLELIRRAGKMPHALSLNDDGSPGHPLYLKNESKPFAMEASP